MELPLALLREQYKTPELKKFLDDEILAKQKGRDHPQSKDPEMRLYTVFEMNKEISHWAAFYRCIILSSCIRLRSKVQSWPGGNIQQLKTAVTAKKAVPKNKACRMALVEGLTTKTAEMAKDNPGEKPEKRKTEKKEKKAQTLYCKTLKPDARSCVPSLSLLQVLSENAQLAKDFEKDMKEILGCMRARGMP